MTTRIINAEEFDGQVKIILSLDNGNKLYLYLCTTKRKIKGMEKDLMTNNFTDISEEDMKESIEEWVY